MGKAKRKIWVDVLTPKQALFAKAMFERAPAGVELLATTRNYSELNIFLKQIGLKHVSFGKHGGRFPKTKLEASIERMGELVPFVDKYGFDCSLSFISPEASRVSFGLGIDHFICSDSPHAYAPSRLAVPLAKELFSPFPLRKENWTQFGIKPTQVFFYHALDPWAWILSSRNKGSNVRKKIKKPRILIRLEESYASYLMAGKGISLVLPKLVEAINSAGDFEIVIIPRYDDQRSWARKQFGKRCIVPESTVDGYELITQSDLVIGGGGTMTQEAALLGVPNVSYFPSINLGVFENFYFPRKLSVKASNPSELTAETLKLLSKLDLAKVEFAARTDKVVSTFEDPVKFIFKRILRRDRRK